MLSSSPAEEPGLPPAPPELMDVVTDSAPPPPAPPPFLNFGRGRRAEDPADEPAGESVPGGEWLACDWVRSRSCRAFEDPVVDPCTDREPEPMLGPERSSEPVESSLGEVRVRMGFADGS